MKLINIETTTQPSLKDFKSLIMDHSLYVPECYHK